MPRRKLPPGMIRASLKLAEEICFYRLLALPLFPGHKLTPAHTSVALVAALGDTITPWSCSITDLALQLDFSPSLRNQGWCTDLAVPSFSPCLKLSLPLPRVVTAPPKAMSRNESSDIQHRDFRPG